MLHWVFGSQGEANENATANIRSYGYFDFDLGGPPLAPLRFPPVVNLVPPPSDNNARIFGEIPGVFFCGGQTALPDDSSRFMRQSKVCEIQPGILLCILYKR